jgi:RNA polymerase sigma-70 factor (ECF subfamily)
LAYKRDREELFNRIVGENKRRILTITRSYASRLSQDDLYQEILLQIWRSLDGFAERCRLSTWVYRVALNTAIRFSRRAGARNQSSTAATDGLGEGLPASCGPLSEFQILEDFIHSLGEAYRGLFLLYLEDLSYGEISEVLDINEGVIRAKISRIKKMYIERYIGT